MKGDPKHLSRTLDPCLVPWAVLKSIRFLPWQHVILAIEATRLPLFSTSSRPVTGTAGGVYPSVQDVRLGPLLALHLSFARLVFR
jgi:hypothetical protein